MSQPARRHVDDLEQARRDKIEQSRDILVFPVWKAAHDLAVINDEQDYIHCLGKVFEFIGDSGTVTAGIIDNIEFHTMKVLRLSAAGQDYAWVWDDSRSTWGRCQFTSRCWNPEPGDFKIRPGQE